MQKILFDTNFFLIPAQFKVDIFSEIDRVIPEKHELFVLDKTIDELNKITKDKEQSQKNRSAASLALQLIKAKNLKILSIGKILGVDDAIASMEGYIVATQDKGLKKRLNCPIITLRAKKKLVLV